ncbi:non-specific lipid-transfer protein A [Beta vulgaris subsp. vulgaris]|uniref:non-specific lipid-transfer protein A n=1 Tax=Beta vulgaris subsp. vulgaris TaxID=3555 RepID=UPI002036D4B2|nr:non-specific lipid-transfer protein A [Beta vulgaris subsp. vulgaris]
MANKITCFLGYIAVLNLLFARSCAQATATAPSCTDVISNTAPCLPYISRTSPAPSDVCCAGIKNVAAMASTHANQVDICTCLKSNIAGFSYDPTLIAALPKKCSVNINLLPISASTDCSKISLGN